MTLPATVLSLCPDCLQRQGHLSDCAQYAGQFQKMREISVMLANPREGDAIIEMTEEAYQEFEKLPDAEKGQVIRAMVRMQKLAEPEFKYVDRVDGGSWSSAPVTPYIRTTETGRGNRPTIIPMRIDWAFSGVVAGL